ncbi:MAG: malonyl-CoA decarboxylase family protein [Alphaproteobacteria bacterium]
MRNRAWSGTGFLGRTRNALVSAWRDVMGVRRGTLAGGLRPDLPAEDIVRLRQRIDECLMARGGEVSSRSRAAEIGTVYVGLSDEGRDRFLLLLANEYGINRAHLAATITALQRADEADYAAAMVRLREVLVPPRIRFLRQFSSLKDGIKFLIDLRSDLRQLTEKDRTLAEFESDFRELLASWFDIGFLELRRITWSTPAALLEKLIVYEAVHEIRSWDDLKNRLDSDRRCYAFFHPRMPDEPLIFVEVALVAGMADNIQTLLDETAPRADLSLADTAIFYSISNAQKGLAGVSFGNFLIKQVIDDLGHDFPHVETFATLSPMPAFRSWIDGVAAAGRGLLEPAETKQLSDATGIEDGNQALLSLIEDDSWAENPDKAAALRPILLNLGARYLVRERRNGRAIDPVAHFHLSNGARIERINWLADRSAKGMAQSAGLMVNYRYDLSEIEANHEAYTGEGRITASSAVRGLL